MVIRLLACLCWLMVATGALAADVDSQPTSGDRNHVEQKQEEAKAQAPPLPVPLPALSSPAAIVEATGTGPAPLTVYPLTLLPWAIFIVYLSFTLVALFQYRFLGNQAERQRRRNLRYSQNWRLIGIFTSSLMCITIMQFGYAVYAGQTFFRSLSSALPWLTFAFGFLPLPVLLVEAMCVVLHPGIGATRNYHNNIRTRGGWPAQWLARLEAATARSRALYPTMGTPYRVGLRVCRLILVYVICTLYFVHIKSNTVRGFYRRPFRATGQWAIDWHLYCVIVLGGIAIGFALSGIDPAQGFTIPLINWTITAAHLLRAYLGSLIAIFTLVVWLMQDVNEDGEEASDRREERNPRVYKYLLIIAIWAGLVAVGVDAWLAGGTPKPVEPDTFRATLLDLSGQVRIYAGGWAPPVLFVIILVLALYYQLAVGLTWQQLGIDLGKRMPLSFMMKARHRGLNLLSPMQLGLKEARTLLEAPSIDPGEAKVIARMVERGIEAGQRMEYWFDEIRSGAERIQSGFAETHGAGQARTIEWLMEQCLHEAKTFAKEKGDARGLSPISITLEVAPQLSSTRLDLNPAALLDTLANLTHNACEAVWSGTSSLKGQGGKVGLRVYKGDDPLYPIVIAVEDSGPGIPPELKASMFEPAVTHGKVGGTGMGLFAVKVFMDEIGGTVAYSRAHAGGARFVLAFPTDIMLPASAGAGEA